MTCKPREVVATQVGRNLGELLTVKLTTLKETPYGASKTENVKIEKKNAAEP